MASVYERIKAFNQDRDPALVALKYRFLSEGPFRFFRGTCHLFYEDLAQNITWQDATRAWVCGDLHLENFGSYKGDNRVVYFDMNDFDEALLAPVTWEVVRLLTSIYIGGKEIPYDEATAETLCRIYLDNYLKVLSSGKPLVVEKETADGLLSFFLQQVQLRKVRDLIKSKTVIRRGVIQLVIDPDKMVEAPAALKQTLLTFFNQWFPAHPGMSKYKALDLAHRIAGTGSVGVKRYVVLIQDTETGKYRLIDVKEAKPSSVKPYVQTLQPVWPEEAERVITLQKRIQHVSPAMLHTVDIEGVGFVLKELQPSADRMDLTLCKGKLSKLSSILITMAQITASGQLRSTGRQGSDTADTLIEFANASDAWKNAVLAYAKKYAAQVIADYNSYCKDYKAQ